MAEGLDLASAVKMCNKIVPNYGPCKRSAGHLGPCAHSIQPDLLGPAIEPRNKLTGGLTNYYLVRVTHPQRSDQAPYTAECEDIIDALGLDPNEANIFKEIWRSANARQGNGKPDHKALYGAEKIVHYAGRILKKLQRQAS